MKQDEHPKFEAGKRKPFALPENYFVDFAEKIVEKTAYKQPSHKKHRTLGIWLSAVAIFAGVILCTSIWHRAQQNAVYDDTETYEMYVAAQLTDDIYYDYYVSNNNE